MCRITLPVYYKLLSNASNPSILGHCILLMMNWHFTGNALPTGKVDNEN